MFEFSAKQHNGMWYWYIALDTYRIEGGMGYSTRNACIKGLYEAFNAPLGNDVELRKQFEKFIAVTR